MGIEVLGCWGGVGQDPGARNPNSVVLSLGIPDKTFLKQGNFALELPSNNRINPFYLGMFSSTVAQPYRKTIMPTIEAGMSICV